MKPGVPGMDDEITDPAKIAAYVKSAKGLYDLDAGVWPRAFAKTKL